MDWGGFSISDDNKAQDRPSLYARLGGVYTIATVVDDFIDRVMIDPASTPTRASTRRITA